MIFINLHSHMKGLLRVRKDSIQLFQELPIYSPAYNNGANTTIVYVDDRGIHHCDCVIEKEHKIRKMIKSS